MGMPEETRSDVPEEGDNRGHVEKLEPEVQSGNQPFKKGVRPVCLTDRASAAATCRLAHYPTFVKTEASVSCMRLLASAFHSSPAGPLAPKLLTSQGDPPNVPRPAHRLRVQLLTILAPDVCDEHSRPQHVGQRRAGEEVIRREHLDGSGLAASPCNRLLGNCRDEPRVGDTRSGSLRSMLDRGLGVAVPGTIANNTCRDDPADHSEPSEQNTTRSSHAMLAGSDIRDLLASG